GLRGVPLVADRFRKQSEEREPPGAAKLVRAPALPLSIDPRDGRLDLREHAFGKCAVTREPPVLRDCKDQLAVAVVLDHGVGATPVHAARDAPGGLLELR